MLTTSFWHHSGGFEYDPSDSVILHPVDLVGVDVKHKSSDAE